MQPTFEATDDGFEIVDPIERRRYRLTTHRSVSPEPVEQHEVPFPIETAIRITTKRITLPTTESILVRGTDGSMRAEVQSDDRASLPRDAYLLDLSGPVKVYARVESTVAVRSESGRTQVTFGDDVDVVVGARSFHRRPADTITTTTEPTDLMAAVSVFGSALKTTSPKRSYPTLRGHPPRLEVGDELHVPDSLTCPETGVRLEVPPTLRHVFVVTPLAYYLGATVEPGSDPRIGTEAGYSYSLPDDDFEWTVERVLKHLFFLDCVVRTRGAAPLSLHNQREIESLLEFDIASMYERPLSERVEAYLEVDPAALEPYYPNWRLETRIEPDADTIEFLPFVADELTVPRVDANDPSPAQSGSETVEAVDAFTRNDFTRGARSTRGSQDAMQAKSADRSEITTITQSWESISGGDITSTTPVSAFHNSFGRTPRDDPIEIEVVCNDADMREELESVNGTYGTREQLPFDVSVHYDLSTRELRDVLATESDFFHYIGHIDEDGFRCSDGKLDASTVNAVGSKAFLLNACQSRDQGIQLVEAGSIGGIVTLEDVVNSGAVRIGSTIAQLLNCGFPLYAALDIARIESIVGLQYLIVGDGRATIAQPETQISNICLVEKDNGNIVADFATFSAIGAEKGGIFRPDIDFIDTYYIMPDRTGQIPVTRAQIRDLFDQNKFPVLIEGRVHWSEDVTMRDL